MKLNVRAIYSILFLYACLMLGSSLVIQYGFGLIPCPLCLIARFIVIVLVMVFGMAYLQNPGKRGQTVYMIATFSLALLGILVTARHLWIMSLPAELVPSCTPGLDYLLENLPIFEAILVILNGSGECAQVDGVLLGLSLPAWTLFAFILLAFGCIFPAFTHRAKKKGSL